MLALALALALTVASAAPGSSAVAAPALSWSPPSLVDAFGSLTSVACASQELCVAVDQSGHVIASANPASANPLWTAPAAIDGGKPLAAVSCPTTGLCVAVDGEGRAFTSTHPTAGLGSWARTTIDQTSGHEPLALAGVSCPTSSLCVAVDVAGNALVSTSPASGPWTSFNIAGSTALAGISCASAVECVAVDRAGRALTSVSPAAGASAWQARAIDPALSLQAVSCAPVGTCAAVDSSGNVFASVDATDAAPAWVARPIDSASALTSVACVSTPICLAVDGAGQSFVSDEPAAVPPMWAYYPADSGAGLTGLSCTQDGFCAAVDANGRLVTTTLPAPTPPSPPVTPTLVHPHPSISGVPAVGSRLVCNPGVPEGAEATLAYVWWRDGSIIANATSASYLAGKADARHHLQCVVTATNAAGSVTAHSAFVTIPAAGILAAVGETAVGKAKVRGGRVEVPVTCSPRALHVCVINLRLTSVEALRGGRLVALYAQRSKASHARQVTITLGKSRARLAPSQRRTIVVSLLRPALRLLARRNRLPAQLTVAGTVIGALDATLARQRLTFTR